MQDINITRREHLSAFNDAMPDRETTRKLHEQYYAQFVDENIKARVLEVIGLARLDKSNDPLFNDIPLHLWDAVIPSVPSYLGDKMRKAGDFPTPAGLVCVAKEAARQIKSQITGGKQ